VTNHERIKNYINETQDLSDGGFCYKDVLDVAITILDATPEGKSYAVLKFLQVFCSPIGVDISDVTDFRTGDPRKSTKKDEVIKEWKFNLTENIDISSNRNPMSVEEIRLNNHVNSCRKVMTEDYSEVVKFLSIELSKHEEKPYEWPYSIRDSVNWLKDDLRKGNSLAQAENVLTIAGAILKYAIDNNMDQLCFEAVRLIMDWGGVYYPQGVRRGNQEKIEELHRNHTLLEKVITEYHLFLNEKIDNVTLMNAGWTKVWSVMFPEKFIMFDSRVSYAFSKLLAKFCNSDKKENGYYEYPILLGYRQIKQENRNVDGFRSINGNPEYWARSMVVSSHILKLCLLHAQIEKLNISRYDPPSLRSIEARLFMMGA
jgi:hypothetical protein